MNWLLSCFESCQCMTPRKCMSELSVFESQPLNPPSLPRSLPQLGDARTTQVGEESCDGAEEDPVASANLLTSWPRQNAEPEF
jgi:hypothetical protein